MEQNVHSPANCGLGQKVEAAYQSAWALETLLTAAGGAAVPADVVKHYVSQLRMQLDIEVD